MKNSMKIIDLHCDTLLECWKHKDQGLKDGPTAINIEKLREGGSMLSALPCIFHGRA